MPLYKFPVFFPVVHNLYTIYSVLLKVLLLVHLIIKVFKRIWGNLKSKKIVLHGSVYCNADLKTEQKVLLHNTQREIFRPGDRIDCPLDLKLPIQIILLMNVEANVFYHRVELSNSFC